MTAGMVAGQVALVTASTSGIGLATAAAFAAAGAKAVILNGRNAERGALAVAHVRQAAPDADLSFLAGDLTGLDAAGAVVQGVLDRHGRIDALVHCGGAQVPPDLFARTDPADYRALIDGYFTAILNCCHWVVPSMVERGQGTITVVASDAGKIATPGEAVIGALKAAAIMFVRTLALEVGRNGVRVNCLSPSLVAETRSYERIMSGPFSAKVFEKAIRKARLGLPTPADIAPMAVFLASPQASKITGQAISINGGISAA